MGCVSAVVGAVEANPELANADKVAATEEESGASVEAAALGAAGAEASTGAESGFASVDSCGFEESSLLSQ